MNNFSIKIKLLRPNASIPVYATDGAAAADLYAALDEPVVLNPSERQLIPTGIAIAPNDTINGSRDVDDSSRDTVDSSRGTVDSASGASFAAIICARSGLASRRGLALAI